MRLAICVLFLLAACGQAEAPPAADAPQAQTAEATHWDAHLLDLLPQIDACIALSPQTRYVNYAGIYEDGVLVRLNGASGELDCRVTGGQARTTPRDAALHIPGEGEAIFVRGPGENPGGECYEAPEVRGANGESIGWMVDPLGC